MPTKGLTEAEKKIIRQALDDAGGGITATHKLLKASGESFAYGSVWNVAHEEEEDSQAKVAALSASVKSLRNKNAHLLKRLGQEAQFNEDMLAAIRPMEQLPPFKYDAPHKSSKVIAAATPLCDWHIGEKISLVETEGVNQFDFETAQRRVQYLATKELDWINTQRHAYKIPVLYVPLLGDFLSGNIHRELEITNEFPVPEACVKAGELLAQFLQAMAPHFDSIEIDAIAADNHGRLSKKPPSKRRCTDNYNWTVYKHAEALLANHKNVNWHIHEAAVKSVNIGSVDFLLKHGDGTASALGIPLYGIRRARGAEADKRIQLGMPLGEILMGHWHTVFLMDDGICCGSLTGYTELDRDKSRWSRPRQVSFLVHPEHGLFNFVRWNLDAAGKAGKKK